MKIEDWLIEFSQDAASRSRDVDFKHTPIGRGLCLRDEFEFQELVHHARDGRGDLDHAVGDFETGKRFAFATQDPKHVVLAECQAVFAKQTSDAILQQVAGSEDGEGGLLFDGIERPTLFQFTLKGSCHGGTCFTQNVRDDLSLHVMYRVVKSTCLSPIRGGQDLARQEDGKALGLRSATIPFINLPSVWAFR